MSFQNLNSGFHEGITDSNSTNSVYSTDEKTSETGQNSFIQNQVKVSYLPYIE